VVTRCHTDIEQVCLVDHRHDHRKTDQLATQPANPDAVAGRQRIGEIAARPRKGLQRGFQRGHLIEIALVHRKKLGGQMEFAHALPPSLSRSATVLATLSRT